MKTFITVKPKEMKKLTIFTISAQPGSLVIDGPINDSNYLIESIKIEGFDIEVSDGYHTMSELYEHRMALFCALCNVLNESNIRYATGFKAWKSKSHSDDSIPFNDSRYFIAGIENPHGQITYHMKIDPWWDRFKVPELEKAPEYDGHTSDDVIERLLKL